MYPGSFKKCFGSYSDHRCSHAMSTIWLSAVSTIIDNYMHFAFGLFPYIFKIKKSELYHCKCGICIFENTLLTWIFAYNLIGQNICIK